MDGEVEEELKGATTNKILIKKKLQSSHRSKVKQHRPGLGLLNLTGVLDEVLPGQGASQPVEKAEAQDLQVAAPGRV